MSITKSWSPGDEISLELPLSLRSETIKGIFFCCSINQHSIAVFCGSYLTSSPLADDRPEYASLLAFLYGPYLLAGLSYGDWDIKRESHTSLSDWITPVPADYNSHLITLAQEFENSIFVLTNSAQVIKMDKYPEPGTDAALRATFRLNVKNSNLESSPAAKDAIGKSVMLELFDFPGVFVLHHGEGESLGVSDSSSVGKQSFVFNLVAGLDGKDGTVSLESESQKGCFIYTEPVNGSGASAKLNCGSGSGSSDVGFQQATSFLLQDGISKYHPISFIAKGVRRNFVLSPLFSLRDESYTVYFNTSR